VQFWSYNLFAAKIWFHWSVFYSVILQLELYKDVLLQLASSLSLRSRLYMLLTTPWWYLARWRPYENNNNKLKYTGMQILKYVDFICHFLLTYLSWYFVWMFVSCWSLILAKWVWIKQTDTPSVIHVSVGRCTVWRAIYLCYHRLISWRAAYVH